MFNKNNWLYWGFLVLIIVPIFHLASASPRHSSGKHARTQIEKNLTVHHGLKEGQLRNNEEPNERDENSSEEPDNDDSNIASKAESDKGSDESGDEADRSSDSDDEGPDDNGGGNDGGNSQNTNINPAISGKVVKRSLKAGDIFTPYELLPVTEKLMKKLETLPGEGRGIVSSSKSVEDMADRIFAAYFLTMKRIVILKDDDIAGLDALQALAIEGEPANYKYFKRSATKMQPLFKDRRADQYIDWKPGPKRSHYYLLTKKVSKTEFENDLKNDKDRRRKIMQLQNVMARNRHLVVNSVRSGRHGQHKRGPLKKKSRKEKHINGTRSKTNAKRSRHKITIKRGKKARRRTNKQQGCTWRYECKKLYDLDTCQLIAKCMNRTNENGTMQDVPDKMEDKKEDAATVEFRRMLGLTVLDEEVEKIIENHVSLVRPENINARGARIESLDEYFNNIIMVQNSQMTTPIPPMENDDPNILSNNESDGYKKKEKHEKGKKSTPMKSYPAQIDEGTAKESRWGLPFGIPLRKNGPVSSIPGCMSDESSSGSQCGKDEEGGSKLTAQKVTPKIVKLLKGG